MSEVLLAVHTTLAPAALTEALLRRRWHAVQAHRGWYRCGFEHGFMDELTRLVQNDVYGAAGDHTFRAAFVHTAEPTHVVEVDASSTAPAAVDGPWRDAGTEIPDESLLGDVLLGTPPALRGPLRRRGWTAIEGTEAFRRPFDLRMFGSLEALVSADLAAAAAEAGTPNATAVWAMSTQRVVVFESASEPRPARRTLPWD